VPEVIGGFVAVVFWALSAMLLVEYEIQVQVLRPWMRQAYALGSACSGFVLAALVNGWRP
jgi:hypothetical protein